MDLVVEMRFGSHLYGTDTPGSDLDIKAVCVPEGRDILLQRVRGAVSTPSAYGGARRNEAGDVDRETYSLQRYLGLLAEGQTLALDMLFAPDSAMTRAPAPLWREIQAAAPRLVSRRASAFLRYCRRQANAYGIKGTRVAAARRALAVLADAEAAHGASARLATAAAEVEAFARACEHATLVDIPTPDGRMIRHLEVCAKRMPFSSSVKTAREVAQRLVDEYGQRALQAERSEGVDWKALSHAVRIGREAVELLSTGRITLPLPYAAHIRSIKLGEQRYETVADEIERLLEDVERAAAASTLPDEPDRAFIDDLVARVHREKVLSAP